MLQLHIEQTEERKDLIELGNRIREQRDGADMSQEQLAEKIGVIGNTISRMELAETVMKVDKLFRILDALEILPEMILPARFFDRDVGCPLDTLPSLWRQLSKPNQKILYNTIHPLIQGMLESQKHQ